MKRIWSLQGTHKGITKENETHCVAGLYKGFREDQALSRFCFL